MGILIASVEISEWVCKGMLVRVLEEIPESLSEELIGGFFARFIERKSQEIFDRIFDEFS